MAGGKRLAQHAVRPDFALTEANPQVLEVLEVSGFLTIMRHFPSAAGAIDYVADAARSSGG